MGGCQSSKDTNQNSNGQKDKLAGISKLNLRPLIQRLRQRYSKYPRQQQADQGSDLIMLQQQIRNIFMGLIKEKIMLANESKITIKECKIEISMEMLQCLIMVLKHVSYNAKLKQTKDDNNVDLLKNFYSQMVNFMVTLARFLKTIYPRGQSVQAGELAKMFKEYDNTQDYEYDILKNAGFVFSSANQFDITNTIKLFLNKIMEQLDRNFADFYKMVENVDPGFKIGRKISENTSKYVKLDTGTVQIKSTEVARVLIKWMQDLSQMLKDPQQKITSKNEYKFYKMFPEQNRIQFSKCQEQTLTKILNGGLLYYLQKQKNEAQKKGNIRKSKFRKFNMHLIQLFNEVQHKQSQVSRESMEVIKYSAFNNSFISWMVEEQLVQTMKHMIEVTSDYQEFRGRLDLIKFKINDLMRCQIFGDRKKIMQVFTKLKKLEEEEKIQIVKIKNRFSTPMSDAMLFWKMPQSFIICECQLILAEASKGGDDAKKAKNIQTLNHFLYELERSPFGVLGQIAVFLTAKAETVSAYCDKINLNLISKKRIEYCVKQHRQIKEGKKKYKQQKSPFVCSQCVRFFKKFENKLRTHVCQKCIVFLCNKCTGQTFQITDEMIVQSLRKRITNSKQEFIQTKVYRQHPKLFDDAFSQVSPQQLLKECFIKKKIKQVNIIKDNFKGGKIKAQAIIEYIHSKEDYVKIYMEKGVKVNFVIITSRGEQVRLKCYRYDHDQRFIVNVFQDIERYENHESMELNEFDLFAQFASGAFCSLNEKNKDNDDGFDLKARSQLERGLYVFQGQQKSNMIQKFESIEHASRHKYLLKTYNVGDQFSLIIDIDHSLKRSYEADKIKQYLNDVCKNNQQKKALKMTDMNINNEALNHFNTHTKWTKYIKHMILSDNFISNCWIVLELCPNLQKLDISRNRFRQLNFEKPLPNLCDLDASENSIKRIINFHNIQKIQTLNLQSNKLSCLNKWKYGKKIDKNDAKPKPVKKPKESHRHVQNRVIQAPKQQKSLFASFFEICNFTRPQETQLSKFNDKRSLKSDRRSDLHSQYFIEQEEQKQVQYEIIQVPVKLQSKNDAFINLRQLILANNEFSDMNEFAQGFFPNITFLNMNDNVIKSMPYIDLDKVQQIHMANNCLKSLDEFAKVDNESLKYLDLRNNKLTELPKMNFHKLSKIDASYNGLEKIEDFVTGDYYGGLTHFYLSHVKAKDFSHMPKSIKVLSIQNSQINDDDLQNIIKGLDLPKLRELYLTRNKITKLPKIQKFERISALFFQENPIQDISVLLAEKQEQQRLNQERQKAQQEKKKKKNAKDDDDDQGKDVPKKGLYFNISRMWLSLNTTSDLIFKDLKQKIEGYLKDTKIVCWKYDSVFGGEKKEKPKRKFNLFGGKQQDSQLYKQLLIKRIYLMNIFEHQVQINNRFELQESTGFYSLEHQWDAIDMDEFVKYDWNELDFIDLRGTGMDDKKWATLVENAYLLPNLREIQIWQHKITTIREGDLEAFKVLQKINFFESTAWSNPLSEESIEVLRQYVKKHPDVAVRFEEDPNIKPLPKAQNKDSAMGQLFAFTQGAQKQKAQTPQNQSLQDQNQKREKVQNQQKGSQKQQKPISQNK